MGSKSEQHVRRAYKAFSERDVETLKELADPKIEIHTVTGMLAGREEPYRGHEGLIEYLHDVTEMWDEIKLTAAEFHPLSESRLVVFGRVIARRELAVIDAPNAWLWEVAEDRIRSARVFGDPQSARELIG